MAGPHFKKLFLDNEKSGQRKLDGDRLRNDDFTLYQNPGLPARPDGSGSNLKLR